MVKQIIGGVITLVIGGTVFAVSQSDIVSNFSKNSGMTQEQAQEYINNISESDLVSFSKIGQDFIDDGNILLDEARDVDCINYTYGWESSLLSCQNGKNQLQKIGNNEIKLGNCYKSLDTDLGDLAKSKIGECILDIDTVNADFNLAIVAELMDANTITDLKNTNIYNKSILESALESE
jgi:hypothetical protein